MENVFELSVGTRTRRGTFQPAFRKVVRTNLDRYKLADLMIKQYGPMEVVVAEVSLVEEVTAPIPDPLLPTPPKEPEQKRIYSMHFSRKLTTEEQNARFRLVEACNKANNEYKFFEYKIRDRFAAEYAFVSYIENFKTGEWSAEGDYKFNNPIDIFKEGDTK